MHEKVSSLKLPSSDKSTDEFVPEPNDPKEFKDVKVAGIDLSKRFDFKALKYEILEKFKSYPAGLDQKIIHKLVIAMNTAKSYSYKNGDKNRYICFGAYHIQTKHFLYMRNEYYPFMFPTVAFINMIQNSTLKPVDVFSDMLLEIHFKKVNKLKYEALYVAQVVQDAPHSFIRKEEFYKEKNYKGHNIK